MFVAYKSVDYGKLPWIFFYNSNDIVMESRMENRFVLCYS